MSDIELTKMSSKGQIVIPQNIRKKCFVKEGTVFAVFGRDDTIILKRVGMPTKEELLMRFRETVKRAGEHVKKLGIKEEDVEKIIHKGRGVKDD